MIKYMVAGLVLLLSGMSVQADAGEVVDINTASAVVIEQLDGIGLVKAQEIIKYREQNGAFRSVDQLLEVSGIGKKTLMKIRGQITLGNGDGSKKE